MRLHPWNYSGVILLNYQPWNVGRSWRFGSRITWVAILEDGIEVKQVFSGCGSFRWEDVVFHRRLKCSAQVINGAAKKFVLG